MSVVNEISHKDISRIKRLTLKQCNKATFVESNEVRGQRNLTEEEEEPAASIREAVGRAAARH